MHWKKHLFLFFAIALGQPSLAFATNGLLQIGYGAKSKAMGGVGVALPQDSFSSAMNPAGMSLLGDRIDGGLHWLHQHGRFFAEGGTNPRIGTTGQDLWWPEIGFNRQVCCTQSFGASLYVVGEWDVHYEDPIVPPQGRTARRALPRVGLAPVTLPSEPLRAPTLPPRMSEAFPTPATGGQKTPSNPLTTEVPDERLFNVPGQGAAAPLEVEAAGFTWPVVGLYQVIALTPSWSWQINTCHSIGIAINAVVGKLRMVADEVLDSVAPAFTIDRGNDYQWGIGARFGWLGQFTHCIQVGATYQTRTYMSHFRKYRGIVPDGGDADLPAQFGVGIAWQAARGLVLSADAVKIFWREGKLFRNAFDAGSGPFGARSGPGLGWDEQMVFKAGVSWDILECLTLRFGYNHGNCPCPRGNILDAFTCETVQDHVTVGATWEWRCHQISFVYLHGFTNTIKGFEPTEPASFMTLKGRQDSVGIEYGYLF